VIPFVFFIAVHPRAPGMGHSPAVSPLRDARPKSVCVRAQDSDFCEILRALFERPGPRVLDGLHRRGRSAGPQGARPSLRPLAPGKV